MGSEPHPTGAPVAHLTSVHSPFDVRIFEKECRTLAEAGFEVTIVAPANESCVSSGVVVKAVRPRHSRLARMLLTPTAVVRRALREHPAVYHVHDPELLPTAALLALTSRTVLYDAHEDLPRQLGSKEWIPRALRPVIRLAAAVLEWLCVRPLAGVVAATPHIGKRFDSSHPTVVQNFPLLREFAELPVPYSRRENHVVYVGEIGVARGARELVRAMGKLPDDLDARLLLGGRSASSGLVSELRRDRGWQRVEDLGWLNRRSVVATLRSARVGMVTLHPIRNYRDGQPVKLFEYMAAGVPVVASNFEEWRRFVAEPGTGLMVDPLDPSAIADAISWLLTHPDEAEKMGQRGRELFEERWNWGPEGERLVERYRTLIEQANVR